MTLFATDVLDLPESQFQRQDIGLVFDVGIEQGIASRRQSLEIAANEDMTIAISHATFSGIGHVAYDGNDFRYFQVIGRSTMTPLVIDESMQALQIHQN